MVELASADEYFEFGISVSRPLGDSSLHPALSTSRTVVVTLHDRHVFHNRSGVALESRQVALAAYTRRCESTQ